ncbi:MAG TPA: hypothetical protein RMH99_16600 [Sandaracinaceae bacterium LLY-WYZ-13_1]|nr:hypothetical protein [Sandaracinaceae bacterium LLY-WYZ-13_1]
MTSTTSSDHTSYWHFVEVSRTPSWVDQEPRLQASRFEQSSATTSAKTASVAPELEANIATEQTRASDEADSIRRLGNEFRGAQKILACIADYGRVTPAAAAYVERIGAALGAVRSPDDTKLANDLMWARHWLLEEETEYSAWARYAEQVASDPGKVRVPKRFVSMGRALAPETLDLPAVRTALRLFDE